MYQKKRVVYSATALLFGCLATGQPCLAEAEHQVEPSMRARMADLQEGNETGAAVSALFRVNVSSEWSANFSSTLEIDHVETGLQDKHSDGQRFNGQPEIPDVPGTDINQAVLTYTHQDLRLRLGRQAIQLGNERFIGSVGAWQNEQTFDAVVIDWRFLSRSSFKYGFINKAHRIFGDDAGSALSQNDVNFSELSGKRPLAKLGEHRHRSHFFNVDFKEWDYWELAAFGLVLANEDLPVLDSNTLGFRASFHIKPNEIQWRAEAEWAAQKYDTGDQWIPYYRILTGLEYESHELSLNSEVLDVRAGRAFTTSLASNHEFQGWADAFGGLPAGGLRDAFLKYSWRGQPWKLDLRWHYFSDLGDDRFLGQEIDADLSFKPNRHHLVLLRVAHFMSETPVGPGSQDLQRLILSYTYRH